MVKSKGKLRGEGPPNQVRIVWTAGWSEPGDKWMMVTYCSLKWTIFFSLIASLREGLKKLKEFSAPLNGKNKNNEKQAGTELCQAQY